MRQPAWLKDIAQAMPKDKKIKRDDTSANAFSRYLRGFRSLNDSYDDRLKHHQRNNPIFFLVSEWVTGPSLKCFLSPLACHDAHCVAHSFGEFIFWLPTPRIESQSEGYWAQQTAAINASHLSGSHQFTWNIHNTCWFQRTESIQCKQWDHSATSSILVVTTHIITAS